MTWYTLPIPEVRRAGCAIYRGRYLGAFIERRFA